MDSLKHVPCSLCLALLQIRTTPLGTEFPSPAMLLLNHPLWGITLGINRLPIRADNNDHFYEALVERQHKADMKSLTLKESKHFYLRVYSSSSTGKQGTMDPWHDH